jgi:hypothetical protein
VFFQITRWLKAFGNLARSRRRRAAGAVALILLVSGKWQLRGEVWMETSFVDYASPCVHSTLEVIMEEEL